ncbi:hypothetical protein LTR56_002881 [Elasticomyces elasticus]|nr:hypothetical protein LTR56_002881 [Elasticomyces elasticus]KAK4930668.1 hypothetical protein LTR49_002755 [Elasticomyces elasticus]KAK5759891.1 hypothetical protein LTS12_009938 [Elasticomyces elasticus]
MAEYEVPRRSRTARETFVPQQARPLQSLQWTAVNAINASTDSAPQSRQENTSADDITEPGHDLSASAGSIQAYPNNPHEPPHDISPQSPTILLTSTSDALDSSHTAAAVDHTFVNTDSFPPNHHLDRETTEEPAFRTKIIDQINSACAKRRQHMLLRLLLPQQRDYGYAVMVPYQWSKEEAASYLASTNPSVLPLDLIHVDENNGRMLYCWIFDASCSGGGLPDVEFRSGLALGTWQEHLFFFDMGDPSNDVLLYFDDLDMARKNGNKVSLAVKGHRSVGGQKCSLMQTLVEEVWPSLTNSCIGKPISKAIVVNANDDESKVWKGTLPEEEESWREFFVNL